MKPLLIFAQIILPLVCDDAILRKIDDEKVRLRLIWQLISGISIVLQKLLIIILLFQYLFYYHH